MTDLEKRLRERLNIVFGGNESDLARAVGTDPQNINNFIAGKVKRSHLWREIGEALGIQEAEMKALLDVRSGRRSSDVASNATFLPLQPSSGQPYRMLPILGEAVGGESGEYIFNGQILDYTPCPPQLANVPGAYAVLLDGVSMIPRYYPRETCYVNPVKPVRRGDHVVVQVRARNEGDPPRGFVKRFVGWQGARLVLEQYNPHDEIDFPRDDIVSVHLIVLSGDF